MIDGLTGDQRFFIGLGPGLAEPSTAMPSWRAGWPPTRTPGRVPLQRRRAQPPRVLRRLRRQGGRQALAGARAARADLVSLRNMPTDAPDLANLPGALRRQGGRR